MKAFIKLKKKNVPFETILGLTFNAIEVQDDQIDFATNTGRHFIMYHQRDCCEEVYVESVVGADAFGFIREVCNTFYFHF